MSDVQQMLTVLSGKADRKKYVLDKDSFRIGRDPGCDIRLVGAEISLIHVMLQRSGSNYVLVKKSPREVLVNGRPTEQTVLKNDDEIVIGNYVFRYQGPEEAGAGKDAKAAAAAARPGAADKKKKQQKLLLFGGAYAALMFLGMAYYMSLGEEVKPIGEIQTGQQACAAATSELSGLAFLSPRQRIQALRAAYKDSQLPNKREVFQMADEALSQERRLPGAQIAPLLKAALDPAVPREGDPFRDGAFMKDPLYVFVKLQMKRFSMP